jgi:hypothetical protein
MAKSNNLSVLLWLYSHVTIVISEYTNPPPVPPGLFEVSTRIEINATLTAAYNTLCDFPYYASWNPFVRYAVVTSPDNITLSRTNGPLKAAFSLCASRTLHCLCQSMGTRLTTQRIRSLPWNGLRTCNRSLED